MTDRANIKLARAHYERHNKRRQEMGLTWTEYIDGEAPDLPTVDEQALAREVARQVDYAELANQVATELEGRMR